MVQLSGKSQNNQEEDAVFTVNSKWEISSFNKAAESLFGLAASKVLGRNCHDIFGKDKRFDELFSSLCPSVSAGQMVSDFNLVIDNPKSNELKAVLATAVPIPDPAGNPSGAIVIFRDSSSGSMSNRMILDSIADGVFTVDRNWKITSFNSAAESITGWKRNR